jgi:hypothetical protein
MIPTEPVGSLPRPANVKPKHGSADVGRDVAFQKIKARVDGTRMAAERLGI